MAVESMVQEDGNGWTCRNIFKRNPGCFEAEIDVGLVPDEQASDFAMRYQSVIGFGTARLLEYETEKDARFGCPYGSPLSRTSHEYREKVLSKVAIIKIDIEMTTGKRSRA